MGNEKKKFFLFREGERSIGLLTALKGKPWGKIHLFFGKPRVNHEAEFRSFNQPRTIIGEFGKGHLASFMKDLTIKRCMLLSKGKEKKSDPLF